MSKAIKPWPFSNSFAGFITSHMVRDFLPQQWQYLVTFFAGWGVKRCYLQPGSKKATILFVIAG